MRLRRTGMIELLISELEAKEIKPGMRIQIEAIVDFHPEAHFVPAQTQGLYKVQHAYLAPLTIGLFTTNQYEVMINDRPIPGRWAQATSTEEASPE